MMWSLQFAGASVRDVRIVVPWKLELLFPSFLERFEICVSVLTC